MFATDLQFLIKRCIAGQQTAMAELVEHYRGIVFGLCLRMLRQREDAEDATQETFVRVLKNLHRWDATRKFEPWLLAIAGNRCRTSLSRRKRRPLAASLDFPLEDDSREVEHANNLREEMYLALGNVRDQYRDAFLMFHEREMSYEEIANELDVPLGTIKTWVHRARREMIRQLQNRGTLESSNV